MAIIYPGQDGYVVAQTTEWESLMTAGNAKGHDNSEDVKKSLKKILNTKQYKGDK